MASLTLRFRRAISTTSNLIRHHHHHHPLRCSSPPLLHPLNPQPLSPPSRSFTSTTISHSSRPRSFDNNDNDDIGPDTILFEGCDYNHWLIVIDFPKDNHKPSSDQMVKFYEDTATKIFGSLEEAKKKIYACSTTTYHGFQVECSEETSEKFKDLPGVIFVLPDSYIDPANKEYGGDKYDNGHITPRPPPIHYGRSGPHREFKSRPSPRGPMEGENRNYGPPVTPQNPPHQGYNPPRPSQHYGPQHQNYGPPQQQNYGPPPQQNFGPPPLGQNYGPPPQQNYGPPPQQSYGPPQQPNYRAPPQQNYGPPPQQSYGPPHQNFGPPGGEGRGPVPSSNVHSGFDNSQSGKGERMTSNPPQYNQGDQRNYGTPENRDFPGPPSLGGNIERAPPTVQGQDPGAAYGQNYRRQY